MILIYNDLMIVCVCENINSKKIRQGLRSGLTLDEIKIQFGLGSQCGSCLEKAQELAVKIVDEPIKNIAHGWLISHAAQPSCPKIKVQAGPAALETAFLE